MISCTEEARALPECDWLLDTILSLCEISPTIYVARLSATRPQYLFPNLLRTASHMLPPPPRASLLQSSLLQVSLLLDTIS